MKFLLIGITLYLVYGTCRLAHSTWKEKNKFASVVIAMIAVCFPILLILFLKQ